VQFPVLIRRRGHRIAQHLLQQSRVVRQTVEIDLHAASMIDAIASVPAFSPGSAHSLSRQFGSLAHHWGTPLASIE
jgi:hypothetical protein